MPWISPYPIVLGVALAAFGILLGRIRGDSRSVIGLYTAGSVLMFFGLAWSSTLGQQAFGALAVASLGAILSTMGSERSQVARKALVTPGESA
jgi:hypothetical protein